MSKCPSNSSTHQDVFIYKLAGASHYWLWLHFFFSKKKLIGEVRPFERDSNRGLQFAMFLPCGVFPDPQEQTWFSSCSPLLSLSLIPLPFCFVSRPTLNLENWEQHQILLCLNRCEIRKITPATLSLQDKPCLLFATCRCSHHSFLHLLWVFALDMRGTEHTGPWQIAHSRKKKDHEKRKKEEESVEVQGTALFIRS